MAGWNFDFGQARGLDQPRCGGKAARHFEGAAHRPRRDTGPHGDGVLPVFVGRATRAVELFEAADKTYVAGLRLGLVTNTEDSTGEVLETRPVSVTQAQLQQALDALGGRTTAGSAHVLSHQNRRQKAL